MKTLFTTLVIGIFMMSNLLADWEKCDGPYDGVVNRIKLDDKSLYFLIKGGFNFVHSKRVPYPRLDFGSFSYEVNDFFYFYGSSYYRKYSYYATNDGLYYDDDIRIRNLSNEYWNAPKVINRIFLQSGAVIVYSDKGVYRYKNSSMSPDWVCLEKINANTLLEVKKQQFAATKDGLFTKDKDSNWVLIDLGLDLSIHDLINYKDFVFAATSNGIFMSQDYGNTWSHFDKSGSAEYYKIAKYEEHIYTCSNLGFYKISLDLKEFNNLNYNLPYTYITTFEIFNKEIYIGTKGAGAYRKSLGDTIWHPADIATKINRIKVNQDELFICSYSGLHQSPDSGLTWQMMDLAGYLILDYYRNDVYEFAISDTDMYRKRLSDTVWTNITIYYDNNEKLKYSSIIGYGSRLFLGTNRGLFQSDDSGTNWYQISPILFVNSLEIRDDELFVIASDCLYKANLNQPSIILERALERLFIRSIAFKADDVYVSNNTRLFKSSDRGNTFTEITQPNIIGYYDIAINRNTIFVGSNDGKIIVSHDDGQSWDIENFQNEKNQMNLIYSYGNYLIVGPESPKTKPNLYRSKISALTTDIKMDYIKNNTYSIYPNPATDYIYINFDDVSEFGDVKIYNTLGECVIHLTPSLSEGEGVRIDVSLLQPGVYFVRVGSYAEKLVKW